MRTSITVTFQTTKKLPQSAVTRLWEYGRVRQFSGRAKQYELIALDREHDNPVDVVSYYTRRIGEIIESHEIQFREVIVKAEMSYL